ncbi:MAG TPA: AAA family ATPase, partial [Trebonia sp.]
MSLDQLLNPHTPPRRYVVTGGPSAGKEAVITEIQKRGIPCTEGEPAREIYRAHRERLGRHLQVGDRRAYSRDVLAAFVTEYC